MTRIVTAFFLILLIAAPASAGVLFQKNFDSDPDWKSPEVDYNSRVFYPWGWLAYPLHNTSPPPGFSNYRAVKVWTDAVNPTFSVNVAGGKSGKGLTYNMQASTSWTGGGIDLYLGPTQYKELYIRFWTKYDANFHWTTVIGRSGYQKVIRISRLNCVPDTAMTCNPTSFYAGASQQAPTFYPDWFANPALATYGLPAPVYTNVLDMTYVPTSSPGVTHPGSNWPNGQAYHFGWPTDQQWHLMEYRVKLNSAPGVADGEWEVWMDGLSDSSHHDKQVGVAWVDTTTGSSGNTTYGWNWLAFFDNVMLYPDDAYVGTVMTAHMDDVVVYTKLDSSSSLWASSPQDGRLPDSYAVVNDLYYPCGAATNQIFSSAPTSNLCADGSSPVVTLSGTTYSWTCDIGNNVIPQTCTATYQSGAPAPGACGSSAGGTFSSIPVSGLCSVGTPTAVTGPYLGKFSWSCVGGTIVPCEANFTETPQLVSTGGLAVKGTAACIFK